MFTLTPVSIDISDYLYNEEIVTSSTSPSDITAYLNAEKLAKPTWYGNALQDFGLRAGDEVEQAALDRFLLQKTFSGDVDKAVRRNKKKKQSARQRKRKEKKEKEKKALELGFAAPKGVSSLFALVHASMKQKLLDGFTEAVRYAIDEVQKRAVYARRSKGGLIHEKAKGLVCAIFTHLTSRAVDPHLHAHVVAITKNMPRFDGTFGSIEERFIYQIQREIRLIFTARLAENVRKLGFDTQYKNGTFEIIGIPDELNIKWSTRRIQVLTEMEQKGMHGPHAASIAARNTRAPKKVHQIGELFTKWENEAAGFGVDVDEIKCLHQRGIGLHICDDHLLGFPELSVEFLSSKLVENKSVFTQNDVYVMASELALRSGQSINVALNVADELLESEFVIELDSKSRFKREFTTKEIVRDEQQMVRTAQELSCNLFKDVFSVQALHEAEQFNNITLSEEQREAVIEATSNNMLSLINGSAGSGKSTIMGIVRKLYEANNCRVYGAAIAKAAAKNLESAAGIKSKTIAKTLIELDDKKSQLKFGDVLIVDEAGQVGLNHALALLTHAKSIGFKIIMIGEDKQLDAIEHGGVLRCLSRPEIVGTTRVEKIIRQREDWDRRAVMAVRDGMARQGLQSFQDAKRISIVNTKLQAIEKLVSDLTVYTRKVNNSAPLVMARTWSDVSILNDKLRQVLINEGKLGTENLSLTGRVGTRVLPFQISVGEKLRFTKNENARGYTNGDIGIVTKIETRDDDILFLVLRRSDETLVRVDLKEYSDAQSRPYLVPAYAQTIYSSQGQTVEGKVFVLNDSGIERSNAYVALSRHRSDCHLYVAKDQLQSDFSLNDNDVIELLALQYSEDRYNKLAIERMIENKSVGDLFSHSEVTIKEQELEEIA